ncbi:MAG: hypothetical protein ACFCUJ_09550 [Thiotrichales bacterium]
MNTTIKTAPPRARGLRVLLKLMSLLAIAAVLWVMGRYALFGGTARELPTLRVDLAALAVGDALTLDWDGRPVAVLHRSAPMLIELGNGDDAVYDPESRLSTQPPHARNSLRAEPPEFLVVLMSAPDLGCPVAFERGVDDQIHGFRDQCRGSRYDLAGRVRVDQASKRNLIVPDYRIRDRELLLGAKQ